ncbi:hypothetical protein AB0I81_40325 [Nonomuraea sp. NPDC050404]|uniref:hypothetical protein n=1 Tax=Nonomuraea sp. NPDC050404 TaxID=3155783 RepID=UPI0033C4BE00
MYVHTWRPHIPNTTRRKRVVESSWDDEYQLCHEMSEYFVTRWTGRSLEETARGDYLTAFTVWQSLTDRRQRETDRAAS